MSFTSLHLLDGIHFFRLPVEIGNVSYDSLFVYGLHFVHIRFNLETFPFLSRMTKCCDCALSFLGQSGFRQRSSQIYGALHGRDALQTTIKIEALIRK